MSLPRNGQPAAACWAQLDDWVDPRRLPCALGKLHDVLAALRRRARHPDLVRPYPASVRALDGVETEPDQRLVLPATTHDLHRWGAATGKCT